MTVIREDELMAIIIIITRVKTRRGQFVRLRLVLSAWLKKKKKRCPETPGVDVAGFRQTIDVL